MNGTARNTVYGYSLFEFSVYGNAGSSGGGRRRVGVWVRMWL